MKKLLGLLSTSDDGKKNEELNNAIEATLNEKQKQRLGEVLENRELAEKLLASDEAQKLLKKFTKGKED